MQSHKIQIRVQPTFHILATTIIIIAHILTFYVGFNGDVYGFARASIERYFVEIYLRLVCVKPLMDGVTSLKFLAERSVVGNVKHQRGCVLLEDILEETFHRRKAEPLCIVAFNAPLDGDGVGLEPIGRNCIGISRC